MESIKIESIEQAKQFDELLSEYQKQNNAEEAKNYIPMESVYRCLPKMKESGRVYSFFLDLKLQLAFLNCDICKMSDLQKEYKTLKSSEEKFINRTHLMKANSDYIFRYRAIWDKVMAIIVLMVKPDKYDFFYKGNSRRKKFKRIFEESDKFPPENVQHILTTIQAFSDKYRTAEAHSSGSSKKFSYAYIPNQESDQVNMFWAWNALLIVIGNIDNIFSEFLKTCEK